ncbi:MAG: RNA polymerase sigma factor [Wenzhouxiangellaceae bacterium]
MAIPHIASIEARIEAIYRADSRWIFATLIRLLGDFDLAEDALQDAFATAARQWREDGIPGNPGAWLVSTARFKAIDRIRRDARWSALAAELGETGPDRDHNHPGVCDDLVVEDDLLRLIFTCCHPALNRQAQVALTLREVCGLTTEEIARAFLTAAPTMAQRIVRAKRKIREASIPFELPDPSELSARLDAVLRVVYLVFNEGYAASSGDAMTRPRLCAEALRLGRLLIRLSFSAEAMGLTGLMLLHDARRVSRTDPAGDVVLLEDQDRSRWDRAQIDEGAALVERALKSAPAGPYALQGAIAAVHAESPSWQATDWPQIIGLYRALLRVDPSPVVELNLAAARAMVEGPQAALEHIDKILERGELVNYFRAHAARAELLIRLQRMDEADEAAQRALSLTDQEPQRRLIEKRLRRFRRQ